MTQTMVTSADESGLNTKDGEHITASLMVWAAGIKAPDFLKEIGGLETNRINQLVVKPTLQTTRDDAISLSVTAHPARKRGRICSAARAVSTSDGDPLLSQHPCGTQ